MFAYLAEHRPDIEREKLYGQMEEKVEKILEERKVKASLDFKTAADYIDWENLKGENDEES